MLNTKTKRKPGNKVIKYEKKNNKTITNDILYANHMVVFALCRSYY